MAGTLGGSSVRVQFTPIRSRAIRGFAPEVVTRVVEFSESYANKAKAKLVASNPPERPNQRYIRTGLLRSKWKVIRGSTGNQTTWIITNTAISSGVGAEASPAARAKANARRRKYYAGYVQGTERQQAWMHAGRWLRVDQAINREEYLKGAQNSINNSLRRLGLMP